MTDNSWAALFDQASALFWKESPSVQFAIGMVALALFALLFRDFCAFIVIPLRRRYRARNDDVGYSPSAMSHAPAEKVRWSPPKALAPNRRRMVPTVRRTQTVRPSITRRGEMATIPARPYIAPVPAFEHTPAFEPGPAAEPAPMFEPAPEAAGIGAVLGPRR